MSNQTTVPESAKSGVDVEDEAHQSSPHGLIVPARSRGEIIVPDVEKAVEAMNAFEDLKSKLLVEGKDKVQIGGRLAITRSGFSKIALAFGLSTEITKISRIKTGDYYCAHVIARAYASNGRYAEGSASCDSTEFRGSIAGTTHNIESKAATRATNRAIANLVGGGILSKEELETDEDQDEAVMPQGLKRTDSSTKRVGGITPKQISYIKSLSGQPGKAALSEMLAEGFDNRPLEDLSADEASKLIDELKA